MLPAKTSYKWKELIQGNIDYKFKSVPAGLIISRVSRSLKNDNSDENINKCLDEVYNFFYKYQRIFQDDITAIFGEGAK